MADPNNAVAEARAVIEARLACPARFGLPFGPDLEKAVRTLLASTPPADAGREGTPADGLREAVEQIVGAANLAASNRGTWPIDLRQREVAKITTKAADAILRLPALAAQQARMAELEAESAHDLRNVRRLLTAMDAIDLQSPRGDLGMEFVFAWADAKARFQDHTGDDPAALRKDGQAEVGCEAEGRP